MQIVLHKSADARVRARTNVDNKEIPIESACYTFNGD